MKRTKRPRSLLVFEEEVPEAMLIELAKRFKNLSSGELIVVCGSRAQLFNLDKGVRIKAPVDLGFEVVE